MSDRIVASILKLMSRKVDTGSANDAIILDIEMPNGNGFDVLKLLKENLITKAVPTIVLSGRNERACKQRMLDLGADCYLTKPLDFSILHEKLAQYVDVLPLGTQRGLLAAPNC